METDEEVARGLIKLRKKLAGDPWTCQQCTFLNERFPSVCEMCEEPNPLRAEIASRLVSQLSDEERELYQLQTTLLRIDIARLLGQVGMLPRTPPPPPPSSENNNSSSLSHSN